MSSNNKLDVSSDLKSVDSSSQSERSQQNSTEHQMTDATLHTHGNRRKDSSLSKREIMEQLSRERFPWDE